MIKITTPLTIEKVQSLKAGDEVLLTGTLYTSRDAGHKRMMEQLDKGEQLPFNIEESIIYYVGPSPAKEGEVIGSAGPTTSYRMDSFTPRLLDLGLKGMIGKGYRSKEVIASMIKNKAVYFGAVGGAAALIANCIKSSKIIAYEELGPEALRKLYVEDFPVIVVIDILGDNIYETEKEKYRIVQ
jgi:fumarate hydratase subunit beta